MGVEVIDKKADWFTYILPILTTIFLVQQLNVGGPSYLRILKSERIEYSLLEQMLGDPPNG